jgi:hypothetical protein
LAWNTPGVVVTSRSAPVVIARGGAINTLHLFGFPAWATPPTGRARQQ